MKTILSKIQTLLEEYSPLSMLILVAPLFIPIDKYLQRSLLFFCCVFPGFLFLLIKPSVLKKPVFICIMLFLVCFSLQDLRGLLPLSTASVKWQCIRGAMIFGPAVMLSCVTPNRKLYPAALWLILFAAVAGATVSLHTFYLQNLFPAQRFILAGGIQHPGHSAMKCGFSAVLAGAFFMQRNGKLKLSDGITLACLSLLLFAMLMSHVRTAVIAVMAATVASFFCIKGRLKKSLCLYAVMAATVTAYLLTMQLADRDVKAQHVRPEGAFSIKNVTSLNGRIGIWSELLSRMETSDWLIGKGLGENYFAQNIPKESQQWYYETPKGFQVHTHSGYVWVLYFSGVTGLGILLALLGTAALTSIREKECGFLPTSLLIFCGVTLLADTSSLLSGTGNTSYLIFWAPLGLAAGTHLTLRTCRSNSI